MSTLYRKHRPQTFSEVVNQNHVKLTLEHQIASGKTAQAYLFCGPRGIGKTTLARVFAKALNCEARKDGKSEPCNKCAACEEINAARSLDIIEIDAASHTGVDNVRENIIQSARVAPSRLKYKVFIIDEVHMLSASAFNALLKTIEEPAGFVIFVLCTTEIHKVPTTIISRCQRFDLKKIGVAEIVKKLDRIAKEEKIAIPKGILEEVARRSEGHMRDAESLLGQLVAIGGKEITEEEARLVIPRSDINEIISLVGYLTKKDTASAIRLINKLSEEGIELKNFTDNLIEVFRKLLLAKINPALTESLSLELGEQIELELSQAAKDLTPERIVVIIEELIKARNEIRNSFILQLPLELAFVKLGLNLVAAPGLGAGQPGRVPGNYASARPASSPAANSAAPAPAETTSRPGAKRAASAANVNISIDQVLEKWNEVMAKVKKHNHSLSFILRVCEPRSINGSGLCLAFKYKFHKDRIDNPNIKAIVEKTLEEVYNMPLKVEVIIDETLEISQEAAEPAAESVGGQGSEAPAASDEAGDKPGDAGDIMTNLLKTFGGRVIE